METNTTSKIWFYESTDGKRIGPISDTEIRILVKNGNIPSETLVWCPEFSNWQPIDSTELLSSLNEAIAPPELPQPTKIFIWLLAVMPLLGYFIERMVWVLCTPWYMRWRGYHGTYFLISMILNFTLMGLDAWQIKRAGRKLSKLWGGLILIPIYIFQRRALLNHNYSYFAVWIVCFVIELFILIMS